MKRFKSDVPDSDQQPNEQKQQEVSSPQGAQNRALMVLQMRAKQLNPNAQTKEFTNNSETIYDCILVYLYELLTTHEKGKKLINAVIDDALHQI